MSHPEPLTALFVARQLLSAGISFIPIQPDGTKKPAYEIGPWNPYRERLPTLEELVHWFANGAGYGIGALGGAISGNFYIWDFDDYALGKQFWYELKELDKALAEALIVTRTPRPGLQMMARCENRVPGNTVLARWLVDDAERPGKPTAKALIETRGEGGYVLLPGCPASCHETGRPYALLQGSFEAPPVITQAQFDLVTDMARSYNQVTLDPPISGPPRLKVLRASGPPGDLEGLRPGDDYNERGEPFADLLARHGAELVKPHAGGFLVRRPGKERSWSATLGVVGEDILYVFSSSWPPFDPQQSYTKFAAKAYLEHGGDFKAAAADLRAEGFGAPDITQALITHHSSLITPPSLTPDVREGLKGLIYTASELAELDLPRPEFVVPELIMRGGVTMCVGWGKMGKSVMYHQLALTIANGGRWLGRPVEARPVLYINFEDALFLTKERLFTQTKGEIPSDNYHVMKAPYGYSLNQIFSFLSDDIPLEGYDMVLYDPIGIAAKWKSEQDNAEVQLTIATMAQLAEETHCAMVPVHHCRKPTRTGTLHLDYGQESRGGGAIFAGCAGYMSLQSVEENGAGPYLMTAITKGNNRGWRVMQVAREPETMTWELAAEWDAGAFRPELIRSVFTPPVSAPSDPASRMGSQHARSAQWQRERLWQVVSGCEVTAAGSGDLQHLANQELLVRRLELPPTTVNTYVQGLLKQGRLLMVMVPDDRGHEVKRYRALGQEGMRDEG